MANSKINTVNVGGVDFKIQASSGSSDASFVDNTIEAALKNLVDSFSVDGTYTGRFKATNTPNNWFSYQIDLFDTIASGYIVNAIDPEESYTVRYRTQTDEQATISSIGKTIAEHDDQITQLNNDLSAKVYEPVVLNGENGVGVLHQYRIGNLVHCVAIPSALIYAINTSATIFNGLTYKPKLDTKIEVIANDGTSHYAWVTVGGKVTNSGATYPAGNYYYFDFSFITED